MKKKKEKNRHQCYLKKLRRERYTVKIGQWSILVVFLLLWQYTTDKNILDSFIFSSPKRVVNTVIALGTSKFLWEHVAITFLETIVSFFLTTFVCIFMAVLLWWQKMLSDVLEPYLVLLNALPKSALAPLLIVWLGTGMNTIVVAGMSVAIFGSIIQLYTCFREIDKEKEMLIYTLGGNRRQVLIKVILPGSVPGIISNMKVNVGVCLVGVVIGEFLAAKRGLGYMIIYGSQVYKLDWVMTAIILLMVMAMLFYISIDGVSKVLKRSR